MSDQDRAQEATRRPAVFYWLPTILAFVIVIMALYSSRHNEPATPEAEATVFQYNVDLLMGSGCHILIAPTPDMRGTAQECAEAAVEEVRRAEKQLSSYDPQSYVSKINRAPPGEMVAVSPLVWNTLMEALRYSYVSDGAFDPAIGALSALYRWQNHEEKSLPSPEAIARAKAACGAENILLEREGMKVGRKLAETRIDLGGLAQGEGVDILISVLRERGVKNAAVEIGGEVRVMGLRPLSQREAGGAKDRKRRWNVAIRDPRDPEAVKKLATRPGYAISTSGDYEKFFEYQGKRYSHIIDPRSGLPVSGGIISATIVVPGSTQRADALATCACVLGETKFREMLKLFPDVEAYLVDEKLQVIHIEAKDLSHGGNLTEEDIEADSEDLADEMKNEAEEPQNFWPHDIGYQGRISVRPAPPQPSAKTAAPAQTDKH